MITKFNKYLTEGLRDKMIGKPEDEVRQKLKNLTPFDRLKKTMELEYYNEAKEIINRYPGYALNSEIFELAVVYNDIDMVKFLLEKGADVNTDDGRLIRYPILANNIEMIKVFLKYGYELISHDGYNDALHVAKRDRKQEIIDVIEDFMNEGLTDKMTAKSDDEMIDSLLLKSDDEISKYINKYKSTFTQEFITKVYNKMDYNHPDKVNTFVLNVFHIIYWNSYFTSLTRSEFMQEEVILKFLSSCFEITGDDEIKELNVVKLPGDVAMEIKNYLKGKGHQIK